MAAEDVFVVSPGLRRYINRSKSRSIAQVRGGSSLNVDTVTGGGTFTTTLRYPIEVMKDDPLGYYRLNESGSLTGAEDVSGNEKNGGYSGNVTNAAGNLYLDNDFAKSFDGVDAFVYFPNILVSTDATLEGIFLWTGGTGSLIRDNTGGSDGWSLGYDNAGELAFRVGGTSYGTGVTVASVQGAWHHYALTKQVGAVNYYLDGTLVFTGSGAPNTTSVSPWYCMKHGGDAAYASGRADEPAIYGTALDAADIQRHYNAYVGNESVPG